MSDEELVLTEAEVDTGLTGDVLIESTVSAIIPKKGKIFDDQGTCGIAVIRPCVSRGARLRGLPPIYTPEMLSESARVFDGWLMYVDHLSESGLSEGEIEDMLAEARRARKVDEMGGRILVPRFDPNFTTKSDDSFGYRPGAVVARAKPVPRIREMIANDPELLHTSINAYPRSARKARAPWDQSLVGMLVEGIRSKPVGSVDWVPRGGAGGHVLTPEGAVQESKTTVALGGHHYSPSHDEGDPVPDLKNLKTPDELREALKTENPALAEAAFPEAKPLLESGSTLTAEAVQQMLAEQKESLTATFEEKLTERDGELSDDVDERLAEARALASHATFAAAKIKRAGLPKTMEKGLLSHYAITEDGIGSGLLTESDADKTAREQIEESITEAIKTSKEILTEAGSPLVEGLGGSRGSTQRRSAGVFRQWLNERAKPGADKDDVDDDAVKTMVKEGIA